MKWLDYGVYLYRTLHLGCNVAAYSGFTVHLFKLDLLLI